MRLETKIYYLDYLNKKDLILEEFKKAKKEIKKQIDPEELSLFSFYSHYDFEEDCLVVGALKV